MPMPPQSHEEDEARAIGRAETGAEYAPALGLEAERRIELAHAPARAPRSDRACAGPSQPQAVEQRKRRRRVRAVARLSMRSIAW